MAATLEDLAPHWTDGALIYVMDRQGAVQAVRPAAFVWATEGGIEWVEPSYADPYGAGSPAYHARSGEWIAFNTLQAGDQVIEALPYDPQTDASLGSARPLQWFAQHLKDSGLRWAEERDRMRDIIDLGAEG